MSLPRLVSLVDLKVWISVPLRRCAIKRVTQRAGFRNMTEPAEREAALDRELDQGFFCDHTFASDIINLERQADVSFVLEGPDGSPPWPTRDEAANHLRLLIYDKLGIAALAQPTAMPQAHSKKTVLLHPPSLRLPRKRGVGARSSGLAATTAEAGVVACSSGSVPAQTAPATTQSGLAPGIPTPARLSVRLARCRSPRR